MADSMFRGIVSTSPDAIVAIDDQMRVTVFNGGAEALFGYSSATTMGASVDDLIPERFRTVARWAIGGFSVGADGARRLRRDVVGLRRDGEEFSAEGTVSK